jgi:hypothetical protein
MSIGNIDISPNWLELHRKPEMATKGRTAYRFVTRSLAELTPFYRLFYESGRKVIPEVALTPLTLAVWFMDDGCRSRTAVYLNTQQFDGRVQEALLEMLRNQWSIDGTLNKDKAYYRIRISVAGTSKLVKLIEPYVIPQLRYKLPQVTP